MLSRILRILVALPVFMTLFIILVINARLVHLSFKNGSKQAYNEELLKELRGLRVALDNHADRKMQRKYPEGYVFINALYALAWSNFLLDQSNAGYYNEGHAEIEKAWTKIDSPTAKATFDNQLHFAYGCFYNGWSTYVLAAKLKIENAARRNAADVEKFKSQCQLIAHAIQKNVYPPSYSGSAWPADVLLCVASISAHDKIFEPTYTEEINDWLGQVQERLDSSGMLPHSVRPFDGKVRETARGSSMSLMLVFLKEIDEPMATAQFQLFKERFADTKLGMVGIREYPIGQFGIGDIDSGPVILGFGGAGTIVGMQTLALFGEHESGARIRQAVEALGLAFGNEESKRYFFGLLPIADAFIVWSHSNMKGINADSSFIEFHLYSVMAFALLSIFFWILVSESKPASGKALTIGW